MNDIMNASSFCCSWSFQATSSPSSHSWSSFNNRCIRRVTLRFDCFDESGSSSSSSSSTGLVKSTMSSKISCRLVSALTHSLSSARTCVSLAAILVAVVLHAEGAGGLLPASGDRWSACSSDIQQRCCIQRRRRRCDSDDVQEVYFYWRGGTVDDLRVAR